MKNPYTAKGQSQFWRPAVAELSAGAVRPVPAKRFRIAGGARIGTAGSCFAQEVAKVLVTLPDVDFLQTEPNDTDQPMFSARYGNIYTVRQLRQLFDEAFGLRPQLSLAWRREDGRWVDAQRPSMFKPGFPSPADVFRERADHLSAVREMFRTCSVFVFTLGLTETWMADAEDVVFPVAPGVVAEDVDGGSYRFHNFSYEETMEDLAAFVGGFARVNPSARCILTVSPVPLIATYTDEHVLVATTYSKSVLRAVCGGAIAKWPDVFYFPSYEIITGSFNKGAYYDPNMRTIARAGVAHVMSVFQETYFEGGAVPHAENARQPILEMSFEAEGQVICDEDLVVKSIGF